MCGGDGGGDGDDVGLMDESIDEGGGDVIAGTTTRVRRPCNGHLTAAASRDPAPRATDQAHAGGQGRIGADWSCDI